MVNLGRLMMSSRGLMTGRKQAQEKKRKVKENGDEQHSGGANRSTACSGEPFINLVTGRN
jgi:hypothetical protein